MTLSVVAMFCIATAVYAQTPTPHPNALTIGAYDFEDLSAPQINLTGSFSIVSFSYVDSLFASNTNDEINFYVRDVDYLILQSFGGSSGVDYRVCVEYVCDDFVHYSFEFFQHIIQVPDRNAFVQIIKLDDGDSYFDYMIMDGVQTSVSSSIVSATATPNPAYIYGTISGVSGTVQTRFDMVVTAGDVAISSALLFLLFSLFSILIIAVVYKHHVW